jgi:hypothetical protein
MGGHNKGCLGGHSRKKTHRLKYEANDKAKKLIDMMEDEGKFGEASVIPGTDDSRAKEAMRELGAIAFGPGQVRDRLTALRTILEFTKEKPAQRSKVTLDKSEEWLLAVEADMKRIDHKQ